MRQNGQIGKLVPIAVLLVLAVGFLAVAPDFFKQGSQSIISVSSIDIQNQGQQITAALAVNNYDILYFIPKSNMTQLQPTGSIFQASNDVELDFVPLGTTCRVPLVKNTYYVLGIVPVEYWVPVSPYTKDTEFSVTLKRTAGSLASLLGLQTVGTRTFNASSPPTVSFTTSDSGNVLVSNLGNLDNGPGCPDTSTVAVLNDNGKPELLDKSSLTQALASFSTTNILTIFSALRNISAPSGYAFCPALTSCPSGITSLTFNSIEYTLPRGSGTALITASMNAAFVGGVLVAPPQGKPQLVSISIANPNVFEGQTTAMTVTVKNVGTSQDTFRVTPTSQGSVSISPAFDNVSPLAGQTATDTFTLSGFRAGQDTVTVTVSSLSTGALVSGTSQVSVHAAGTAPPTPGPIQISPPVNVTPIPSTPIPSTPTPLVCSFPSKLAQTNEPIFFGLLGNATTQSCQLDSGLLLLALFIPMGFAVFFMKR